MPLLRRSRGLLAALVALGGSLGLPLTAPPPAAAGLLRPLLLLMRPQLESRLSRLCLEVTSADNPSLERTLRRPCERLAAPASHCLVDETSNSGKELEVMAELLGGQMGSASEAVLKRCAATLLGLPPNSFDEVPLAELGRRFRQRGGTPGRDGQDSGSSSGSGTATPPEAELPSRRR